MMLSQTLLSHKAGHALREKNTFKLVVLSCANRHFFQINGQHVSNEINALKQEIATDLPSEFLTTQVSGHAESLSQDLSKKILHEVIEAKIILIFA